ncbi:MAG: YedE-related selenium metabolism membrane protein [Candidatus Eisenbacteria bacterium]|uniref:YedE-related selenium metabolism membrane protein n=1 Tax=Eiseniibacteriota bacterium TaxID=2212470 RepID=A0A937X8H8_UNCEI|nr:YedE-related selenium metabolism membrane protein [Candidatus Eisenbacteria bacterium]
MSAREGLTRFFASRGGIVLAGGLIGLAAALLQKLGNPANMGVCVACFTRDIAGALGLHRAAPVQYLRPEIPGFVLGALLAALLFREFRPRGGSAPVVRFVLGVFAMIGALAFLGCPWRALLRLAGGDLTALIGLAGLAAGIAGGVALLRSGYSLGRSQPTRAAAGLVLPGLALLVLFFALLKPGFILASAAGPGSLHAALGISLVAGLVVGLLAQRTRFCTMGAIRDLLMARDAHLLSGVAALVAVAFAVNLALGRVNVGFAAMPIAHSQVLWNFLGMALAGLAFAMAGGCPGRQLFLCGEGDGDAGVFVLGMLGGAAAAHNFGLAASPDRIDEAGALVVGGVGANGQAAVVFGLLACVAIGFAMRERWK